LAEPAFIPNTTIVSADMNSDLSDIATGLSTCLTTDGQSSMTAQIKGFAGTVSLPGYAFASDTNTGMYRIGADNVGIACNGAKVLDIATTGLSITGVLNATGNVAIATNKFTVTASTGDTLVAGTLAVTGITTLTGALKAASGTVSLPGLSFSAEPDCGLYVIGTNNIGLAVNAAKVLDIATTGLGVTGAITATTSITATTTVTATTALSGATAAGAMIATQAEQETGTATDKLVTPGRQHFHISAAKCWCKFTGSTGAILNSYNITSVTSTSVGDWDVVIANDFSTANWCFVGSALDSAITVVFLTAQAAGTCSIKAQTGGGADKDPTAVFFVGYDDLP
jgi:hypothetical protein